MHAPASSRWPSSMSSPSVSSSQALPLPSLSKSRWLRFLTPLQLSQVLPTPSPSSSESSPASWHPSPSWSVALLEVGLSIGYGLVIGVLVGAALIRLDLRLTDLHGYHDIYEKLTGRPA